MAISVKDECVSRATNKSAAYPGGSYKPESAPGTDDGTPYLSRLCNDDMGLSECILSEAGIAHNNQPDSLTNPQKMNGLRQILKSTTKPPQAKPEDACSGFVGCQISDSSRSPNFIDTGFTIVDSCLAWDIISGKYYILVLNSLNAIVPVTGPGIYSTGPTAETALSLTFPATPDHVGAICTDAHYLYVLWCTEAGNWHVSKFGQASGRYSGSALWSSDTGSTWTGEQYVNRQAMCIANSEKIAVMLSNGYINERKIVIVDKDDGINIHGTGSWATPYGDKFDDRNKKIVSDGTHVFWLQYSGSSTVEYFLMSSKISAPGTSDYASESLGSFDSADEHAFPSGILCVPGGVVMTSGNGSFSFYSTDTETLYSLFSLDNFTAYGTGLDGYSVELGFDGTSVWAHFIRLNTVSGVTEPQETIIVPINASCFNYRAARSTVPSFDGWQMRARHIAIDSFEESFIAGKLIFDMIDLWFITRGGNIHRIANPGVR